jgi:peptidoglycan/LPS O-acetylase OafA/YrhL
LRSYAKRLLPLFIAWSIISAFVPSTANWWQDVAAYGVLRPLYWQFLQTMNWIALHPLGLLWFGTMGHLWFIPALLVGLVAVALLGPYQLVFRRPSTIHVHPFAEVVFSHRFTLQRVAIPVIAILYVVGLIERSNLIALPEAPLLPYYIRTGLFMTLMFTTLGWWLSFNLKRPTLLFGVLLLLAGYALQVIEEVTMWHYLDIGPPRFGMGQYLIGTIPFLTGVFMIALVRPNIGQSTTLPSLASMTLGVYLCHLPIVKLLNPVRVWLHHPLWDFALPFVVYLLAIALTLVLSKYAPANTYLVQVKKGLSLHVRQNGVRPVSRVA